MMHLPAILISRSLFPMIWQPYPHCLITGLVLLWLFFIPQWNGTTILVFGNEVPGYPVGLERHITAGYMLHEALSWLMLWNVLSFFNQRLLPLAHSFQLNQFLWLKLSPASPLDLCFGRIAGLVDFCLFTLAQSIICISVVWARHGLNQHDGLHVPLATLSYQFFTFSTLFLLMDCFTLLGSSSRVLAASVAILPFLSYLFYSTIIYRLGRGFAHYHPAVFPFVRDLDYSNSLPLLALGTMFLISLILRTTLQKSHTHHLKEMP